jgi:hypothetical protein
MTARLRIHPGYISTQSLNGRRIEACCNNKPT